MSLECKQAFLKMAGGEQAVLVVIPTATADEHLPTVEQVRKQWGQVGFKTVKLYHHRDREHNDSASNLQVFDNATAVWFSGGDQSRLSDAYAGTELERKLISLQENGLVIGGSSAGAAILSKVMIASGKQAAVIRDGLNLLPSCIIDQHFLARSRINRLITAVSKHPLKMGIGIDEGTALIIKDETATVIGDSYAMTVLVRDGRLVFATYGNGESFETGPKKYEQFAQIKGFAEVSKRFGSFDRFVIHSATKAENFRQQFLKADKLESKSQTLARLADKFKKKMSEKPNNDLKAEKQVTDSIASTLMDWEQDIANGFLGSETPIDGQTVYGSFSGRWYGRWTDFDVDHNWSPVETFQRPKKFTIEGDDAEFYVDSVQYAWVGDGYGLNLVTRRVHQGKTSFHLLGYVEHIKDGDFAQVTARRPHVGLPSMTYSGRPAEFLGSGNIQLPPRHAEPGRLVWVTSGEVFIERTFGVGQKTGSYSIVGFNFETNAQSMSAKNGFISMYGRNSKNRFPFRALNFDLKADRNPPAKNENEVP